MRNHFVVGIRDKSLSERLRMDVVLMLEKAKAALKHHKAIQDTDSCGGEKVVLIQSQQMHFKVKQNNLTKSNYTQIMYLMWKKVNRRDKYLELMPYAIGVTKWPLQCPLPTKIRSKLDNQNSRGNTLRLHTQTL